MQTRHEGSCHRTRYSAVRPAPASQREEDLLRTKVKAANLVGGHVVLLLAQLHECGLGGLEPLLSILELLTDLCAQTSEDVQRARENEIRPGVRERSGHKSGMDSHQSRRPTGPGLGAGRQTLSLSAIRTKRPVTAGVYVSVSHLEGTWAGPGGSSGPGVSSGLLPLLPLPLAASAPSSGSTAAP